MEGRDGTGFGGGEVMSMRALETTPYSYFKLTISSVLTLQVTY